MWEEFENQGWDEESKRILLEDFLDEHAKECPDIWDKVQTYLQTRADAENEG